MNAEDAICQADVLRHHAARARSHSRILRAEVVRVALQIADTEEAMAKTLARLASQDPHNGHRLRALSQAAAKYAASERQWADEHACPQGLEDESSVA
jgi:hypothetical protein